MSIDKDILDINQVVCDNVALLSLGSSVDVSVEDWNSDKGNGIYGLVCQNVLAQLRNLVEALILKACEKKTRRKDWKDYETRRQAIKGYNDKLLKPFYGKLQHSVSHYTVDKRKSEFLMHEYISYLFDIRDYVRKEWNLEILENLENLIQKYDKDSQEYYEKIACAIEKPGESVEEKDKQYNERYYIQSKRTFSVNGSLYYEVSFTVANVYSSKFNRILAFTKHDIMDNYAVAFPSIHSDIITVHGIETSILVIDDWEVAIRPCEFSNLHTIIFNNPRRIKKYHARTAEYRKLMAYMKESRESLAMIVSKTNEDYEKIKNALLSRNNAPDIFSLLDECRAFITQENKKDIKNGKNTILYLLHTMRNDVIKKQYPKGSGGRLSEDVYLSRGCFSFENAPYRFSLQGHNTRLSDLYACIPERDYEYQRLGKLVEKIAKDTNQLFISKDELPQTMRKRLPQLIREHNNIWKNGEHTHIKEHQSHVYIHGYAENTAYIIEKLKEYSMRPSENDWHQACRSWLSTEEVEDSAKKNCLESIFHSSSLALIYGSAGTGKTTLLSYIYHALSGEKALFLAQTHAALDSIRRTTGASADECMTIDSFVTRGDVEKIDIMFVDECSTVSNDAMKKLLNKIDGKVDVLVLSGDIYQIESIDFGNWFTFAKKCITDLRVVYELDGTFRTDNENLKKFWKRVRESEKANLEDSVHFEFTSPLDEFVFGEKESGVMKDEIILCLNYDGIYGINNINQLLQNSNPAPAIEWNGSIYKKNDPIIFDSPVGSSLLHNNSKGRIVNIEHNQRTIIFDIRTEEKIDQLEQRCEYSVKVLRNESDGNAVIRLEISKNRSDEDDEMSTVVPFHVAYTTSIHKSQGLEYDSVKIIITDDTKDQITHDIFYTAITRAKNELQIYWNPEAAKTILRRISYDSSRDKDFHLLRSLKGIDCK